MDTVWRALSSHPTCGYFLWEVYSSNNTLFDGCEVITARDGSKLYIVCTQFFDKSFAIEFFKRSNIVKTLLIQNTRCGAAITARCFNGDLGCQTHPVYKS